MMKVLIVDDEEMMLLVTSKVLSEKYEVICASSGEEAIKLYDEHKPSLILSDLLPQNRKRDPFSNGLRWNSSCTSSESPSIPLRRSV